MTDRLQPDAWLYVAVLDPDGAPQYLGLADVDTGRTYIPAFARKEDAQQGMPRLAQPPAGRYEIQAVAYDQLARDAAAGGFAVYLLDAQGRVLDTGPQG